MIFQSLLFRRALLAAALVGAAAAAPAAPRPAAFGDTIPIAQPLAIECPTSALLPFGPRAIRGMIQNAMDGRSVTAITVRFAQPYPPSARAPRLRGGVIGTHRLAPDSAGGDGAMTAALDPPIATASSIEFSLDVDDPGGAEPLAASFSILLVPTSAARP